MTDPIAEQSIRELSEELETARKDRQALVEQGAHYKREYEAALARAEAAEETLELRRADFALESKTRVAAESRLAEAKALPRFGIRSWMRPTESGESMRQHLDGEYVLFDDLMRVLSVSTPAPAAWDIRGKEPVLVAAPAAESELDPERERMRNIVRNDADCWGLVAIDADELEVRIEARVAARLSASRANYGDLLQHRNELDDQVYSLESRIAELEAKLDLGGRIYNEAETRIAQAVAVLEPMAKDCFVASAALAILKGTRT